MSGTSLSLARDMSRDLPPEASQSSTPEPSAPGPAAPQPAAPQPAAPQPAAPKPAAPELSDPLATGSTADYLLNQLNSGRDEERKRLRWAGIIALIVHLVAFFITFPSAKRDVMYVGKPGKVFVMQQTRFKKPPAKAAPAKQQVPKKKARKIPIPDPTPDDPEPIELEEIEIPDIEPTAVTEVVFGIPDAPADSSGQFGTGRFAGQAMQVGNGVEKPVAISKPRPNYTEDARQRRIQGVVILQGIVDEKGDVRNLKVVKGLPFGLDDKALEAVYQWKFKPSSFEGKPVAVHFHFTVNFMLQ